MNTPEINALLWWNTDTNTYNYQHTWKKNNTSILCKWIIQIERKIFLFAFFITFNYVVVTIRER